MKFLLRPWRITDLYSLVKYANNPNIAKFMTNGFANPYNEENGKAFIAFATKDNPIHIFAIDIDGEAIGGIGIHPQNDIQIKNAELGYWLAEPFWGKGIITFAIKQIVEITFETYPEINRIFARPYGTNIASQKALEKAGFVLEASIEKSIFKNDEELDELIYGFRR